MKFKRIIALALAAVMCFALAACGGNGGNQAQGGDQPQAEAPGGSAAADLLAAIIPADVAAEQAIVADADLQPLKVGVILYDTTCKWAKDIMKNLNYLGQYLNVTFESAVGGTDPAMTIEAVENFGAAGYNGIINLHPGTNMPQLASICQKYGMYIVTSNDPCHGQMPDNYGDILANPYYAGEVWEDDYQIAYDNVTRLITEFGCQTFALHGFPYGLSWQMDQRLKAATAAIADNGAQVVVESLDFDKASAAEAICSQYPDVDAIFSSVETITTAYQPLVNAGLGNSIMLNCYDPGEGCLEAMQEGVVNLTTDGTCADSMVAFILLYNAMTGNKMVDADGNVPSIQMSYVVSWNADDYALCCAAVTGDNAPYYFAELAPFITVLNPDANAADLAAFVGNFSLDDVVARHTAQ